MVCDLMKGKRFAESSLADALWQKKSQLDGLMGKQEENIGEKILLCQ